MPSRDVGLTDDRRFGEYPAQLECQIIYRLVNDPGLTNHFEILWCSKRERAIAGAHGFDQRRVSSTNFSGMHVAVRVLLQRAIILTEDEPEELDARVLRALETGNVFPGIRRAANYNQRELCIDPFISLDDKVRVILGFKAADVKNVTIRCQTIF